MLNLELTKSTYEQTKEGGCDSCICDDCKNFANSRELAYPEEIKQLFKDLGIDYKKEVETYTVQKTEVGLYKYYGWFHFKGSFTGKNCSIPLPNGGFTLDLTPISENFSIGFSIENSLTFFESKKDLVQIEFETYLPWIFEKL